MDATLEVVAVVAAAVAATNVEKLVILPENVTVLQTLMGEILTIPEIHDGVMATDSAYKWMTWEREKLDY